MMKYVYLRETTKMGAEAGHDDLVSADYICHAAIDVIFPDLPTLSVVPRPETAKDRFHQWLKRKSGTPTMCDELGANFMDVA